MQTPCDNGIPNPMLVPFFRCSKPRALGQQCLRVPRSTLLLPVDDLVRQREQELRQAALRGRVVAQHGRKGRVAQGLGEALPKRLSGTSIVR